MNPSTSSTKQQQQQQDFATILQLERRIKDVKVCFPNGSVTAPHLFEQYKNEIRLIVSFLNSSPSSDGTTPKRSFSSGNIEP